MKQPGLYPPLYKDCLFYRYFWCMTKKQTQTISCSTKVKRFNHDLVMISTRRPHHYDKAIYLQLMQQQHDV
ncbi:hypothetical protein XELAEV_18020357mg [Xenopus laevis]|uniref:Uncharacterized protein n=1 Tax=Xenopus laevis TaxID=8355 RepID=A0A974D9J5_XENLA|nr:hypothetical protein XELAEV_18020357mg [Xenopus laevis]